MKRNDLVARSLTLGLAVATAAASMSTPGGLMAPVTVQAAEQGGTTEGKTTLSVENVATYLKLADNIAIKPAEGEATVVVEYQDGYSESTVGKVTVTFKNAEGNQDVEAGSLEAEAEYKVFVNVDNNGTAVSAAESAVELGTVTAYAEMTGIILTYKNGEADQTGCTDLSGKIFTDNVIIDAGNDNTIGTDANTLTATTSITKPAADGDQKVVLFVKKSETTYAKRVTLSFDVTAPEITAATVKENDGKQVITADSATLSVTANEAGKVYYKAETEEKTLDAAAVKGEGTGNVVDVTEGNSADVSLSGLNANTQYYIYLVAEDTAGNLGAVSAPVEVKTLRAAYSGTPQPVAGEFTKEGRTLTFTFAEAGKTQAYFDYTLDGGESWTNGDAATTILSVAPTQDNESSTTITLTLPTDAYEANAIKVRVAETKDHEAGEGIAYTEEIKEGVAPTLNALQASDVTETKDTSVKVNVISNENGKVYALAKKKGEQTPDAAAVKEANKSTDIKSEGTATEVTVDGLTANTEYVIYFVAEDAAENLSEVQSVEVTTLQTALTGTAKLEGETTVGQTLTASVQDPTESATLQYKFVRVTPATEQGGEAAETTVQEASTTAEYVLQAADAGSKIKVVVTADGYSGSLTKESEEVQKKPCIISLGDASSLFASGVTGDAGSKVLNVTIPETAQSAALEYSFDGTTWVDLSGETIPLANKSYDVDTIKVRVKETEDTKAGTAVAYNEAIKATLDATVEIAGTLKYNETLTAKATIKDDAQSGATFKISVL